MRRVGRVDGSVLRTARRLSPPLCCSPLSRPRPRRTGARTEPGQFDFYVLALSWSPSFCEAAGERGTPTDRSNAAGGRFPSSCMGCGRNTNAAFRNSARYPPPRLDRNIVSSMLDLMPAPRLIFHEWDKHGICSGLDRARLFRHRAQGARAGENSRKTISSCESR